MPFRTFNTFFVSSVLLWFDCYGAVEEECVDRPYYYYTCKQLIDYCQLPQATGVRLSCPVTCGLCGNTQPTLTIQDGSSMPASLHFGMSDAAAHEQIQSCCGSAGLTASCMKLCRYNTTRLEVISGALTLGCKLDDAKIWIRCAAQNRNNMECCQTKQVERCDQFCEGNFANSFAEALYCLNNHLSQILGCHRNSLSQR